MALRSYPFSIYIQNLFTVSFFFYVYLFILREKESISGGRAEGEREWENPKQAPSLGLPNSAPEASVPFLLDTDSPLQWNYFLTFPHNGKTKKGNLSENLPSWQTFSWTIPPSRIFFLSPTFDILLIFYSPAQNL